MQTNIHLNKEVSLHLDKLDMGTYYVEINPTPQEQLVIFFRSKDILQNFLDSLTFQVVQQFRRELEEDA